jgi:hypothetical protein
VGANDRQVGGDHYQNAGVHYVCPSCTNRGFIPLQHWDLVKIFGWDYFQGQIIKYVMRWRDKNGVQDLEKAEHFLEKYIEDAPRSLK